MYLNVYVPLLRHAAGAGYFLCKFPDVRLRSVTATNLERSRICPRHDYSFLLLALTVLASHLQATAPVRAQSPFEEIELRLSDGIFNKTLPFDVPFILHGDVPDTATTVTAYVSRVQPTSPPNQPCSIPTSDPPTHTWRRPSAPLSQTTPSQFRLLMPALDVNTVYCMRFTLERTLPLADEPLLTDRIVRTIDQALRRANTATFNDGNLDTTELDQLRRQLVAAVRAANPGEELTAPSGSIFAPHPLPPADASALPPINQEATAAFGRLIPPILRGHISKEIVLAEFEGTHDSRPGSLILGVVDDLSRMRDYLQDNPLAIAEQLLPDDVRVVLRRLQTTSTTFDELKNLAAGLPPGATGPAQNLLHPIWDVESIDPCQVPQYTVRLAALRSTSSALQTLSDVVESALDADPDGDFCQRHS